MVVLQLETFSVRQLATGIITIIATIMGTTRSTIPCSTKLHP